MVRYLDEASVRAVLRWDPLTAAMESALAAFSSGQVIQPVRNMLTIEEGKRYLGIMPAVMQEAMGVKLVSFYPGNAGTGLPTHFGIILLSRSHSRYLAPDGPNRSRNPRYSAACGLTLACPHPKTRFVAALFGRAAHDRHCVGVLAHSAGHSVHA